MVIRWSNATYGSAVARNSRNPAQDQNNAYAPGGIFLSSED